MIKRILHQQQHHPVNLFRLHPAKTSIIKQKIEKFYAPTIGEQRLHPKLYNTTSFFQDKILKIHPQNYDKAKMENHLANIFGEQLLHPKLYNLIFRITFLSGFNHHLNSE